MTSKPSHARKPITPNPPRWKPNPDPSSIHVPGLDTDAPVHDQIEQIEQLITIKLQNIDENFSKIHNVLANKLLPAVKRYAVGTEPVRQAAKFWTSFYEQAAQIRIPTSGDHSTVNEFSSEREYSETVSEQSERNANEKSQEITVQQPDDPTISPTDDSFRPNQDALSSTPATLRATQKRAGAEVPDTPSWSASFQSPFERLSQEVKAFSLDEDQASMVPSTSHLSDSDYNVPTPTNKSRTNLDPASTGKEKASLRENVLRHQLYSATDMSSIAITSKNISPLKPRNKPKTPVPTHLNPYLPPGTDRRKWTGVVDLRDPSTTTPHRSRRTNPSSQRKGKTPKLDSDDEDDFDALPPGMSPPVMMSPVRLSKTTDRSMLAPTPSKNASARIGQAILKSIQKERQFGHANNTIESSLSTMPTPPSFSQYQERAPSDVTDSLADPSFDSMMRRVGLDMPLNPGSRAHISDDNEGVQDYNPHDMDSDDSLDEFDATAHPSGPFLMVAQEASGSDDDSFGSSNQSSDSLNDEEAHLEGAAPVHPFAGDVEGGFDDDDSFDDYNDGDNAPTETLFGVPPGQRLQAQPQPQALRMLGADMFDDVTAAGTYVGGVEESPTPAFWAGNRG